MVLGKRAVNALLQNPLQPWPSRHQPPRNVAVRASGLARSLGCQRPLETPAEVFVIACMKVGHLSLAGDRSQSFTLGARNRYGGHRRIERL